ncbi:MAG: hypothetical protein AAGA56_01735, partial [Myxococcota bacterium]
MVRFASLLFVLAVSTAAANGRAKDEGPEPTPTGEAARDTPATSSPSEEALAAARGWFTDALALEKDDAWAEALALFERVGKVKMTPQVRFHIGLCHENLGKFVKAINQYEIAAQEAARVGEKAEEVSERAPRRAEKLRARVAELTLRVKGEVARLDEVVFLIDDEPIAAAVIGSPIPIDPGAHRIEVQRPGRPTVVREVVLDEGGAQEVEIDVPPPVASASKPPGPSPLVPSEPESAGTQSAGPGRWPAYVVGGAGLLSLGAAGALWALRGSTLSGIDCSGEDFTGCDPDDRDQEDRARTFDVASKATLGVGAGLVAAGVVLFFVLDEAEPTSTAWRLTPLS